MTSKSRAHTTLPLGAFIRRRGLPLLLLVVCSSGCGQDANTIAVRGNVLYKGEKISSGVVTFFPIGGRSVTAPIVDGEYATEMPPGDYTLVVILSTQLPPGFKEGDRVPPPKIVLPEAYTIQAKSTLTAKVPESGPFEHNLDLK